MKNLKILRESLGLSQRGLAQEVKMSNEIVSKYEKGDFLPNGKALEILADYFTKATCFLITTDHLLDRQSLPNIPWFQAANQTEEAA